jgi:hypothetical protein
MALVAAWQLIQANASPPGRVSDHMSANPYETPKASVADISAVSLIERPKAVVLATKLMCIDFLINLVLLPMEHRRDRGENGGSVYWALSSASLALSVILVFAVWKGRSWGRWAFLVVLAVMSAVLGFVPEELPPDEMALNAVLLAIDLAVCYLLFTSPGAQWFQGR